MKITAGAFFRASAKRSRTRAAPLPTKSSTNSEAATLKNGTFASPATAFARSVLPVPGGPTNRQPVGRRLRTPAYLSALLSISTSSTSSALASSTPATSSNVTRVSESTCPRLLARFAASPPPCLFATLRMMKYRGTSGIHSAIAVRAPFDR